MFEVAWPEAILQSFAFAIFACIFGAMIFPVTVAVLLLVLGTFIGLILSILDLVSVFFASAEARRAWHRRVNHCDYRLSDAILGQNATVPLRPDLADCASQDTRKPADD